MLLGSLPDSSILRHAPLRSTGAACSQGRLLPGAAHAPPGVAVSGSESKPVNSGSSAIALSSPFFAAAASLVAFQSIPVYSHHLLGTRVPAVSLSPHIGPESVASQ